MNGKNILLCVSGGIAVYKAAALTSKLKQAGAHVKVVMTDSAQKFVAPITFQALSGEPVYTDTFDEKDPSKIAHIDIADWADLVIVAPATANMIAKMANGIADDMMSTVLLAGTAPKWVVPAMNVNMYVHPAVQRNMETLKSFSYRFIEPGEGYLACGYTGKGRMEEPEVIARLVEEFFDGKEKKLLSGKQVVVTAGPTREAVDPVRFFTNKSSGKMGYAIAEAAYELGADVTLISGPVSIAPPSGVTIRQVESAEEMFRAVMDVYDGADLVVKTAAVADYRPRVVHENKMKKQEGSMTMELDRTRDILKTLGERKTNQFLVGFAAETNDVKMYAKRKLESKNADMIVANNVNQEGAGFGGDTNIISIFHRDGTHRDFEKMTKKEAAVQILKDAAVRIGEAE
ncbi:bifunctional phosphopantothenoylcysteine decarboxylase/phosphopantothenate--cysteine ligase CoaBC [Domibacillus sp. A3M-37]|uniref:bifunctional phosphopantothenoylcysteine decarboxylase/phosphopantothenate--cysteine ligase CoaBC n=1 Tax=Domibacillus sp. A3M-37 TaxID=2962037 RepID=UPI0020B8C205|nr:bifunctional phosphopantothenoylcysteine decarboxylase/phosphopantothenate--cysteine ligase CoaBC [Domibacillus sp. A3M-37]MCP3761942.1 bifunctional phosphopantothenoylcysteine decarboxylase/phosphopantothenate--cysteine ligase CoaBC [Domibacillus sp. A3M-37]